MSTKKHERLVEGQDNIEAGEISFCGYILIGVSLLLLALSFPFSLICSLKVVQEYERAVIFRLGRLKAARAQGPGLFFILPCVDNFVKVDLRTFTFNIAPQEVLTKDSVTVVVDAVIYARIRNATQSVLNVANARGSTYLLGATTLRTVLGTAQLSDLLADRDRLDATMQTVLDEATENWGVQVERVEIKDVRLPVQMQRAMAAEAESAREARAKVIAAQGEMNAARSLKEAADVMSESPLTLQLRYLQTLHTVAEEKNSTIVFPLPMSFAGTFSNMLGAPPAGETTGF